MKFHVLFLGVAFAFLSVQPAPAEVVTELTKHMENVNDSFKAIRKETDPAKGAVLAREGGLALLKSLAEVPASIQKLPEAEKAKASANFRTRIGKLYVAFSEIEEAFLANDLEKVKTLLERVREEKKEGHSKYIEQ